METFRPTLAPLKLPNDPTRADHGATHPEHYNDATGEPLPSDRYDPRREPRSVEAHTLWYAPNAEPEEVIDHNGRPIDRLTVFARVGGIVSVRVSEIEPNGLPSRFHVRAPGRVNGREPLRPLTINGVAISGEGWVSVSEIEPIDRAHALATFGGEVRYVVQTSADHGYCNRIDGRGSPSLAAARLLPVIMLAGVATLANRHTRMMHRQSERVALRDAESTFRTMLDARVAWERARDALDASKATVEAVRAWLDVRPGD